MCLISGQDPGAFNVETDSWSGNLKGIGVATGMDGHVWQI